jgi:hypothetical protein
MEVHMDADHINEIEKDLHDAEIEPLPDNDEDDEFK